MFQPLIFREKPPNSSAPLDRFPATATTAATERLTFPQPCVETFPAFAFAPFAAAWHRKPPALGRSWMEPQPKKVDLI